MLQLTIFDGKKSSRKSSCSVLNDDSFFEDYYQPLFRHGLSLIRLYSVS